MAAVIKQLLHCDINIVIYSLPDISKEKESLPVLKEKLAKQFLRRVRRSWRSIQDNANEECCVEACTYEEVKEYPCSPY